MGEGTSLPTLEPAMNERDIFLEALRKESPAERSAYLDRACAGDVALRRRLEVLLQAHGQAGSFLERPAAEQLAAAAALPENPTAAHDDSGNRPVEHPEDGGPALDFLQEPRRPGSLGRLGHYEVLDVVGRGGMGIVLRAFDDKLHRVVAIKVMAAELAANATARQRFTREARAAAAVAHEHVVTIHAVEEDHRPPYLVMQFVEGISLQDKLDRAGPLGVTEILRIGLQVAEGLAAAHKHGLVHRDVKPANILLENGVERVQLTDFGLARAVDDASLTQSGVLAGTPAYMSPEQAEGLPVDHRSDLFSLGSVLYALCTGHPPFRAGTAMAVLRRVADDTPRPIREVNPGVAESLCALIARLHAKDPAQRFHSAGEVAELLAHHLARLQQPAAHPLPKPSGSESGRVSTPSPLPRGFMATQPVRNRHRWVVAAVVVVALAAGLGVTEATGVTKLSGTVIRLFSPEGTLIVEVDDPSVSVTIDGRDLVITGAGPKEIRLKPGQYRVTASKDGKVIKQEVIAVTKDGRPVVRVSREEKPVAGGPRDAGPAPAELERLVQLAQQKAERVRAHGKLGRVSHQDVLTAEGELVEAKLRLAAVGQDGKELDRLFAELVALRQASLQTMQKLYVVGRVPRAELEEAEKVVLEAQLRWKESRAARGEPERPPPP
jgi:serine/threonine protein kinase